MKAWIVYNRFEDCCTLVHAETSGKAKSKAAWNIDCEFIDVTARRLPGLDDKPITYQNAKEAGFQYTDGTGYDKHGEEEDYFLSEKWFTNNCDCDVCKGEVLNERARRASKAI